VISGTQDVLQRAASLSGSFFIGALGSLVGFAIMLCLLFFFLRDGDAMVARVRLLIPLDEARKDRLFSRLSDVTRAIVYGTTLTALLQGLLLGIGFAIAGLPSPVVFGVLAALLSMLPVGGAAFVWVPAVGWLFYDGRWGFAIFMIIWGLMLAGLDNVLRPLLISGRARISALAVFVGVLGGIPAFGAIGVIAGPVVLSLALALIEFAEESRGRV
jgi:predicted PurR-regulated permease PerM